MDRRIVYAQPELTAAQRLAGYNRSLALRQARAELKKDLRDGKLQLREVLGWDWVKGMKVHDLLRALPGIGAKKATAILDRCLINQANTVGRCSQKQLERLVSQVSKMFGP